MKMTWFDWLITAMAAITTLVAGLAIALSVALR